MNKIVNIEDDLDFQDVLIQPSASRLSSRKQVSLTRSIKLADGTAMNYTPIIAANMTTVGTVHIASQLRARSALTALHKHYTEDRLVEIFSGADNYYTFYTLGISQADLAKYNRVKHRLSELGARIPLVCIDVANGYMYEFVKFVETFKRENPEVTIMAGNVVCSSGAYSLLDAGATIIKVGIGSGSACLTRRVTGVGRPQVSAVMDVATEVSRSSGFVCSDGGCVVPGDIAKAFVAGADFVMLGGMLAGHDDPEINHGAAVDGKRIFYGMSSDTAMNAYSGGMESYRASEGRTVLIPDRGDINKTLDYIEGGIRSACTYTDSATILELQKNATFRKVRHQLNTVYGE